MTHLEFQRALEGLEIFGAVVDFRHNSIEKRFEIRITAKINDIWQTCSVYFLDEWLNDTRKCNEVLDTFTEKIHKSIERARNTANKFNIN